MSVARTILDQMGGMGRIRCMTGAKNFVDHGTGVSFQFPNKLRSKPNVMKVDYDEGADLYTVTWGRVGKFQYTELKVVEGVYCDMLIEMFERETGLYLHF